MKLHQVENQLQIDSLQSAFREVLPRQGTRTGMRNTQPRVGWHSILQLLVLRWLKQYLRAPRYTKSWARSLFEACRISYDVRWSLSLSMLVLLVKWGDQSHFFLKIFWGIPLSMTIPMSVIIAKMTAHVTRANWPMGGSRANNDSGMKAQATIPPTIKTAINIQRIIFAMYWGKFFMWLWCPANCYRGATFDSGWGFCLSSLLLP